MSTRDSQKSCCYAAETILEIFYDRAQGTTAAVEIGGSTFQLPPEARFASIESIQAYCDQVIDMMGLRPVKVRRRKGATHGHYEPMNETIAIADHGTRFQMREIYVLHELAHHMSPGQRHGPQFVANFIELLSRTMGPEVGMVLRLINAEGNVKEGV
jgi:putative metallohydrolase (TIGR04338 family)